LPLRGLPNAEEAGDTSPRRAERAPLKEQPNWSKERGRDPTKPDTSAIMEPIARGLNGSQIAAVAAYLNDLE
jgi:hypothetical protein